MNKTVMLDIPATAPERMARSEMIAEVESLKDAVVDAAVEWHESGREGDDTWFEKGEALAQAIEKLLARRTSEPVLDSERSPERQATWANSCKTAIDTIDRRARSAKEYERTRTESVKPMTELKCDQCYYCCRYGCVGVRRMGCTCPYRTPQPPPGAALCGECKAQNHIGCKKADSKGFCCCHAVEAPAVACTWTEDPDGNWDTSCENKYIIIEGTPSENGMKWCTYCGKRLEEVVNRYDEPE